jgi:hypothetical protein
MVRVYGMHETTVRILRNLTLVLSQVAAARGMDQAERIAIKRLDDASGIQALRVRPHGLIALAQRDHLLRYPAFRWWRIATTRISRSAGEYS